MANPRSEPSTLWKPRVVAARLRVSDQLFLFCKFGLLIKRLYRLSPPVWQRESIVSGFQIEPALLLVWGNHSPCKILPWSSVYLRWCYFFSGYVPNSVVRTRFGQKFGLSEEDKHGARIRMVTFRNFAWIQEYCSDNATNWILIYIKCLMNTFIWMKERQREREWK